MCRSKEFIGKILLTIIFLGLSLALTSCGSSGGGGGGSSDYSGGGTGGTGIGVGTISAFGSIFVNENEYDTAGVPITVNGSAATENDLEVGMKVEIESQNGSTVKVDYESEIRGPIDSIDTAANSLVVLGQTVITDSTSIFKNIDELDDLDSGDIIEVSGFFDANNNVIASYIEFLVNQGLQEFKIKGTVLTHDPSSKQFTVSGITVDYSNVASLPVFGVGSFVEVEGTKPSSIFNATLLNLDTQLPAGNPGDNLVIEGIITELTSQSDFEVNGQRVNTNAQTNFKRGTVADIALNAKVKVKGSVDSNGILNADEVMFRFQGNSDVDIEGSVEGTDPVNSTVTVFGREIHVTLNTKMMDRILNLRQFNLDYIQSGDYLEIRVFLNNNGELIAERIVRVADSYDDEITGAVDIGSEIPFVSITIRGITIDVSGQGVEFEDANDNEISAVDFFTIIDDSKNPGDIVEAEGSYSEGSNFVASEIEIKKIH
jgi:hypothetical protein